MGTTAAGDAQVSLIPAAGARCARRGHMRDPRRAGQQRQGTLTLTPSRGPSRRRRRVGTQTHAYIKNNNNKNLLALQMAQPAQGDRLAWHFQTSRTCPNSIETTASWHAQRYSLQHGTHPGVPLSGRQQPCPPNPTAFQTEICFASRFPKERLLSLLKQCTPRSRWGSGAGGVPFFGWRRHGSMSPWERGLGEAGNSTVSHAGQAADPGGSWD